MIFFAVVGFIVGFVACCYFTMFTWSTICHGGGDLGPLWTSYRMSKAASISLTIFLIILCGAFWTLLFMYAPFSVVVSTTGV